MKSVKTISIATVFLFSSSLFAADEESELDFVSTSEAFEAAEKNSEKTKWLSKARLATTDSGYPEGGRLGGVGRLRTPADP